MAANTGRSGLESASEFYPVTPNDGTDLTTVTREIIVSVGGNIVITRLDGTDVTLTLPAGRFALKCVRIKATGTTATGITAVT